MTEKSPTRPKNVVVVDANNPLVEVQGEFFWREDHDAIVSAVRDEAYRRGYSDGWKDSARSSPTSTELVLRRRPRLATRLLRRAVVLVLVLAFVSSVLLTVLWGIVGR